MSISPYRRPPRAWNIPPAIALLVTMGCLLVGAASPALARKPVSGAPEFPVAVVPSDDGALADPVARDQALESPQILDMARRAVDLVGGMASVVPAGAELVVIKPNVGSAKPEGAGVNADPRLVRAVVILVHEVAPEARILVAEGPGGWMSPSLKDCTDVQVRDADLIVDGFELGGYRREVNGLRTAGIDVELFDLNFDETRLMTVPGGGLARDEYDLPVTILDADAWINVPVAKTHGAKITCCMKNHFGLLPGTLYGWSKSNGTENHPGMPHAPRIIDECWVDLVALTRVDLNVVDMIRGTEAGAFTGAPKRSNIVLAGRDPMATDLVVGQLMGFNPDDFEFADLAGQRGMGPGSIDRVEIRGGDVAQLASRYKKAGVVYGNWGEWGEHADYGKGARRWTLLGPLDRDHAFTPAEIAITAPTPGAEGWSPVTFFGHDKIDLDKHYDDPVNCSVYAYTTFHMPESDSVRFWAGSDEDLTVWIDGQAVYEHEGRRRHHLGQDKSPGFVEAGEHRLLVRAGQRRGGFDFSFNICEPIDDRLYAGNTYPGLRYQPPGEAGGRQVMQRVAAEDVSDDMGFGDLEPHHEITLDATDPLDAFRQAPASVNLDVPSPTRGDLVGLLLEQAGLHQTGPGQTDAETVALDSTTLNCVSHLPFGLCYIDLTRQAYAPYFAYGPHPVRVLSWMGLRYGLTFGFGARESAKSLQGWLAQGYAPLVGLYDNWGVATAYRTVDGGVEFHLVSKDTSIWVAPVQEWQAQVPGGQHVSCPVVVARPGGATLSQSSLADSVAAVALEMLRRERFVTDRASWGERYLPTGLAAWDAWVLDWERQPWTIEWADRPETRGALATLADMYLGGLAEGRSLAAQYFAGIARTHDVPHLAAAGHFYGQTAGLLRDLAGGLRSVASEETEGDTGQEPRLESVREASQGDGTRREALARVKPAVRQIRASERAAAEALRRHLGDTTPLAPAAQDPLRHKGRGYKLLTWHTDTNQGVYDLTLRGTEAGVALLDGKEAEGVVHEVLGALPQEAGWLVAVEVVVGHEFYRVEQQPTADNDWTAIVRIDETFNFQGGPCDLTVWLVPGVE